MAAVDSVRRVWRATAVETARITASAATPPSCWKNTRALRATAQLAGDRVQTEYYLQYADHYFRVLEDSRSRFEQQEAQRRPRRR